MFVRYPLFHTEFGDNLKRKSVYLDSVTYYCRITAVLTRKDCLHIPRYDGIQYGIKQHHHDTHQNAEIILGRRAGRYVIPLNTNTLFLVLREITAAKSKGNW